jgi:hypothetical protein
MRALHVREAQPRPSLADCEEDIFFREDARVRQVCRNPCARAFYLSASIQTGIRCVVFVVVVAVVVCDCCPVKPGILCYCRVCVCFYD